MNYLLSLLKEIVKKRKLIWDLSKADFRKRFVGSYFGIVWMFIQPIVTVLVYFFVFGVGFKTGDAIPGVPFILWLVPGIIPWFFFSEALNAGTNCLQEYHYLVKKVVFRVEILPIIKLISCLIVHLIFVLIMFVLYFCYMGGIEIDPAIANPVILTIPRISWIQIIYYTFATFMLSLAISYFTSAINVFFKDMAQIVGICLQFGMWLTPIMWYEEMFADKAFFPVLRVLLKLNPMYYVVAGYRDSMITGAGFWQRPTLTLYFWGITLVLFILGLKVFKKLRPHFSDVL